MIRGIRSRLTIIFISLAVLPLVGLSFFMGWQSFDTERNHATDKVKETARWVGTEVGSSIKVIASHIQVIVHVRGLADISPQERKDILEELLAFHQEFESLSYLDEKGMETFTASRTELTTEEHVDRANSDEFLLPASTRKTYYGPVAFSDQTGEPFMDLAEPVVDPRSNTLSGVLVARVRLKKMWDIIAALDLKPGEDVYIIDSLGRVIAHRNPSVVLRETIAAIPGLVYQTASENSTPLGLNGKPVIYSSFRIPLGERNLDVIAEQSIDEAFQLAYTQMKIFLIVTLFTLLAAILIIVIVTGTIVRPIQHLAAVARDIMNGKLDSQAKVLRDDELGELAATFNNMTVQLRNSLNELHQEIKQKDHVQRALQKELRINAALSALSHRLLTLSDIREIAYLILDKAKELTDSRHGFVSLEDPGEQKAPPVVIEITDGTCSVQNRENFSAHPLNRQKVFFRNMPEPGHIAKNLPSGHVPLTRVLNVPVFVADAAVGQITLAGADRDYTEADVAVIERLAWLFALAVSRYKTMGEKEKLESALRQAQKMEAIGTLAGGIAHDFNNILTPILGYAELIQATTTDDSVAGKDIKEIIKATKRAIDLVGQILTFSRRKEHKLQQVTIQPILKETLKLLRATIPTSIEIRQRIAPDCGAVLADPTQIHQIIMNLCTNAYHAMQEKGGTLAVSLQPVTLQQNDIPGKFTLQPGEYVRLEVSDSGSGMSQDVLNRIFEPYFSTKAEGKGTGLGLSVVLGIVKGHGGDITVSSEPGQGTTFQVYLPQVARKATDTDTKTTENIQTFSGREHILLVDDEITVLNLEKKILRGLGYQVSASTESSKALQLFLDAPDKFDLIITDMTMPGMNGTELAKSVLAAKPDFPIIICTGYSELITAEKAQEIGIKEYISKPISLKNFAATVHQVLNRRKDSG